MSTDDAPQTARAGFATAPRWLRVALLASIALNVLVLGVVAGGLWKLREAATMSAIGPSMLAYSQSLPQDRRDNVRRLFAENRPAIRPLRRATQEARAELRRIMTAEPYDMARAIAAHRTLVAAEARQREAIGKIVAMAAERLSASERREFFRWLAARRGQGDSVRDDFEGKDGGLGDGGRRKRP
jgi:uncharacterized membrane protein